MKIRNIVLGTGAAIAALAGQAIGQVQHGAVNVVENDGLDTAASITATRFGGFGPWTIDTAASSRGDYVLNFGTGSDNTLGILINAPYQLERYEPSVNGGAVYYATVVAGRVGTGYSSSVWSSPAGTEVNLNTTVAFFPLADQWLAGALYNSANNGVMTSIVGNATLRTEATYTGVGAEVVDYNVTGSATGFYLLHSDTIDFRRDGVLLVTGAKDEDNRASWSTNYVTGEAFLWCQDNGADASVNGENDPVAFVFVPENTTGVTMGTVTGAAKKLFKQGDFNVSMVGQPLTDGTFRLTIPGESPETGTVLVAPYVRPDRAGTATDNPCWIQPDGDGWLITTRDQPGPTLQDLTGWDVAFSFAFFKNGVDIRPGTPSKSYLSRMNEVAAARFAVTEIAPDNGNGDMDCVRSAGSDILDVAGANRGDNQISYLGALLPSVYDNGLDAQEGFMLGSVTEFVRDNSTTLGLSGWSTLSFDNGDAVSHVANPTGGEINSNFALVHFAASRGFVGGSDVAAPNGLLSIVSPAADAMNDGVLMAINWDNNNRSISVKANGANYDMVAYESQNVTLNNIPYTMGTQAVDSVEIGYVYLPYSTPGMIAAHVAADGSVLSSRGDFSITTGTDATYGFPVFELTIPGVDARNDGILLLNAAEGPYAMSWEAGENGEFEIAGLELTLQTPGLNAFSFVYIPYEGFGAQQGCPADFNGDDFLDFFDYDDYVNCFETGACPEGRTADFNGDAFVDFFDYDDFVSAFEAGC